MVTKDVAEPVHVVAVRIDPEGPVQPATFDQRLNLLIEILLGHVVFQLELNLH